MATSTAPTLLLGDTAPDFKAETTMGKISFHDWIGNSWCVLFSHPKSFTPVCTTELGYLAKMKKAFDQRNVKLIALSVDDINHQESWIADINETQGTSVNFPIICDVGAHIAGLYGMIHPKVDAVYTIRRIFVIDPKKSIRLMTTYPQSTGRDFTEILRVIDSMQMTDKHHVATPVNWKKGEDCIILPSVTDAEELKKKFPKGFKTLKPYLRITPDPE